MRTCVWKNNALVHITSEKKEINEELVLRPKEKSGFKEMKYSQFVEFMFTQGKLICT